MRIFALDRSFYKLYRQDIVDLSPVGQQRLRIIQGFERLRRRGITGEEAAEILGSSRSTIYRWRQRLAGHGPRGLEPGSRRPKRVRRPVWSSELVQRVESLRKSYPMWGKQTLTPLLIREGFEVSVSTVGRILTHLMDRGVVDRAPQLRRRLKHSRRMRRFHAQRWSRGKAQPKRPGELIQIDTMHVSLIPGVAVKHFTAYCPISRWTVSGVYKRASSLRAKEFLEKALEEFPFPVEAIQVDGGSEFKKLFEADCQARQLPLYVLPPRSPNLNGGVERANQTFRYEFYNVYELPLELEELRTQVQAFQHLYNTYRPHQSLHGQPPAEYLCLHQPRGGPPTPLLSHMS